MADARRSHVTWLGAAKFVALAAVACALGASMMLLRQGVGQLPVAWPANAVFVALLIRSPKSRWAPILVAGMIGDFVANFVISGIPLQSVLLSVLNGLEILICSAGTVRLSGGKVDLSRPRDMRAFAVLAAIGAPVIPAFLAAICLSAFQDVGYFQPFLNWWSTDAVGLLIITPAVLVLTPKSLRGLRSALATRMGALSFVMLAASLAMAFGQSHYPTIFLIPTSLIFVAFELGQAGAALALLITAVVSIGLAISGHRTTAMTHLSAGGGLMALQIFLATMTLLVLPVSAALAQRKRLEEELCRKRDEAEEFAAKLAESQIEYETIANGVRDIIVRYDRFGVIQYISPSARQFGFEPEEIIGLNISEFEEREFGDVSRDNLKAYSAGKPFIDGRMGETRVRVKDGRLLWLEGTPSAIYDDTGAFAGVVMVMRDVTARRELEEELKAKTFAAQAASEAKSQFLANMSHEIRTPLTGIIGFAELLEAADGLPTSAKQYVDRISTSGHALLSIVNDVLDFSKLEAGQVEIDPQPFSPSAFLNETTDLIRDRASRKGLEVILKGERALPALLVADSARLRQILLNLLTNAVKFTTTGAITVDVSYAGGGELLTIAVHDTGVGVPPDLANRLFRRFSQVDGSNTRQHGGSGLGLAISKGLAELMGGEIGVESQPGVGSTFWFTISAQVADAPQEIVQIEAQEEAVVGQTRILLVDDVANNRDLVMAMLAAFDIQFVEACNGSEAVAASLRCPFDLILMDLQMPGMDGLAATAAIRANSELNAQTPILALSANVLPQQIDACLKAGMNDHIGKPINLKELLSKIAWWTSEAAQSDSQPPYRAAAVS